MRTPLATVVGFARTMTRMEDVGDPLARYLAFMDAASGQLSEILDDLAVVARIHGRRYDPVVRTVTLRELADAAKEQAGDAAIEVAGEGEAVVVDEAAAARALAHLARAALRHGDSDTVTLAAHGDELVLTPVGGAVGPILLGEDLRDFGAAVAAQVVSALGGSLELTGEALVVRLPRAGGAQSVG